MDWRKLKAREKALLVAVWMTAAAMFVGRMVYGPMAKRTGTLKTKIEKNEARIRDLKASLPNLEEAEIRLHTLEYEAGKLTQEIRGREQLLPGKGNLSQLLGELTRLAKSIRLGSIKQRIDTSQEDARVFVEISFSGSYQEAVAYVRRIESISPYLRIEEFQMKEPKLKTSTPGDDIRLVISSLLAQSDGAPTLEAKEEKDFVGPSKDIFFSSKMKPVEEDKLKDLHLEGVTYNAKSPTAIINGEVIREGSKIEGYVVKQILFNQVILTDGTTDHLIGLDSEERSRPK